MIIRNAKFEDMKLAGHIMSVSFRTAFAAYVSQQTMDACAQEDNCIALLEGIFREGRVHFLMGENSGMLAWQETENSAEIIAVHSLPESIGTGLGAAMLEEALAQLDEKDILLDILLLKINLSVETVQFLRQFVTDYSNFTAKWCLSTHYTAK